MMAGKREAGARASGVWLQGMACGALLTFAAPTALLLAVLMAPALICRLTESPARQGCTRAVALACAAAALGPAWRLWLAGDRMVVATASLLDPAVVGLAWGGGAIAWALCEVIPVVLAALGDAREAARARALEAEIRRIEAEWDLE